MTASRAQSPSLALWLVAALGLACAALWLVPTPHAVERHGVDALVITDAYNQGAQCNVYVSTLYNRKMTVIPMGGLNGLIFTTKYGSFITAFFRSPERTAALIIRDGYVPVCEK